MTNNEMLLLDELEYTKKCLDDIREEFTLRMDELCKRFEKRADLIKMELKQYEEFVTQEEKKKKFPSIEEVLKFPIGDIKKALG